MTALGQVLGNLCHAQAQIERLCRMAYNRKEVVQYRLDLRGAMYVQTEEVKQCQEKLARSFPATNNDVWSC